MTFEDYLAENKQDSSLFMYNYKGINRKKFPRWMGWKLIDENGLTESNVLELLVENFFYVEYLREKFIEKAFDVN